MRLPGGKVRRGPCGWRPTSQGDTMSAVSLEAIVAAKGSARPHFKQSPGLFVPSGTSVNSTWGRSGAGRAAAARTLPYPGAATGPYPGAATGSA